MKRFIKSLVLVTLLIGMTAPAWGQASTQGTEFWVSSSIVCSPSNGKGITPYIAVSAEEACTVNINGGVGNAINITQQVAAGSWNEFGNANKAYNTNPTQGLINVQMDASKWYPINTKEPATVCNLAGQKNMYGLHITATDTISVYVILGGESSMDASNILPLTALGAEYYVQDYTPEAHNKKSWSTNEGNMVTVTTILGTEDNTTIDIIPNGDTFDGWTKGSSHSITLNQGQTYYLISKKEQQLAGTHIMARDGRKIAIYTGAPLTRLPNGVSARDALFEQPLPIEYWGTQFVVTRSLGKYGNLIGITATNNSTEIKIDGETETYINEGDTYYIMLQSASNPQEKNPGTSHVDQTIVGDVLFIETSCPCAVYSYDTGNAFKGDGDADINGDPSSVWISPVQQKIKRITFGTCYTSNTKDHFLNVVTETATCQNTKLTALYGASKLDKTNLLTWTPVPGNAKYSYARAQIGDASTSNYSVFRLENTKGFIATVYGNGNDESYAYSAGSAAVEVAVEVESETFTDGYVSESRFCIGNELKFDADLGGKNEVTLVNWNFGDGITDYNSTPQIQHAYTNPGWYDVEAELYGHQVCTQNDDQLIGKIKFSFRVVRQDTVLVDPIKVCLTQQQQADTLSKRGQAYLDSLVTYGKMTILNPEASCNEDIQISLVSYGLETGHYSEKTEYDSAYVNGKWYYPETLPADGLITWITKQGNEYMCDLYDTCYVHIKTCLVMDIPNTGTAYACQEDKLQLPFIYNNRGDIGETHFICEGIDSIIEPYTQDKQWYFELPTQALKPNLYKAQIIVQDTICDRTLKFPLDFSIYYPSDVFKYKFNNVLSVYNKENNGGYDFTAYQWLLNGIPIVGATSSVYHIDTTFVIGQHYSVILTRSDGVVLPSCSMEIEKVPEYTTVTKNASATKHLINQRLVIRKEDKEYNIYGQRMK